jgi:rubrerythrin
MAEESDAKTIGKLLERAIGFEEQAYAFYMAAVDMVQQPHIKDVLRDMAGEEIKHKNKLQALLDGDTEALIAVQKRRQIQDLKLAEYLVAPPLGENATFQDVLVVAMRREKSSHEFYATMATIADDDTSKELFEFLAQEELMHKNKIETLYDEVVYRDN